MRLDLPSICAGLAALLLCGGCLSSRPESVEVADVDGSGDHRIFRIGALTQIMMEPVLWRLEDSKIVDFDRPVTSCIHEYLPPEFDNVTLRQLHEGKTSLPRTLNDLWRLNEVLLADTDAPERIATRAAFARSLWDARVRVALRRDEPGRSDVGYALLMMAVCDVTGRTLDDLCREYLVEPYGLRDTSFSMTPGMATRLAEPRQALVPWLLFIPGPDAMRVDETTSYAGGMFSSAHDILRVCYVVLPHIGRMRQLLDERELPCGRKVLYRTGRGGGCRAFVCFDAKDRRAALLLRNSGGSPLSDGLGMMERIFNPPPD
ncbi:MAG: beta-lactamase family protein [Kiritimatiellae bacterium]|nr:beta-lactamase family protein [Kiritimatiellia bacterium]